jgi:hypothetical protein
VSLGCHRSQANAAETRVRGKLVGDRRDLKTADYATKVTVAAVNGERAQAGVHAVSAVNAVRRVCLGVRSSGRGLADPARAGSLPLAGERCG